MRVREIEVWVNTANGANTFRDLEEGGWASVLSAKCHPRVDQAIKAKLLIEEPERETTIKESDFSMLWLEAFEHDPERAYDYMREKLFGEKGNL